MVDLGTLGGNTVAYGSNIATPAGTLLATAASDGEDRFIVNRLQSMAVGLDLVKRGDISANVEMLPGDVLIIPQGWF